MLQHHRVNLAHQSDTYSNFPYISISKIVWLYIGGLIFKKKMRSNQSLAIVALTFLWILLCVYFVSLCV